MARADMRMGCDSSDLRVSECISDALEVSKKAGPSQKSIGQPKDVLEQPAGEYCRNGWILLTRCCEAANGEQGVVRRTRRRMRRLSETSWTFIPRPIRCYWSGQVRDAASGSRLEMQLSSCSRKGVGGVSANGCGWVGIAEGEVGTEYQHKHRKMGVPSQLLPGLWKGCPKGGLRVSAAY